MNTDPSLPAKVQALNAANAKANALFPKLVVLLAVRPGFKAVKRTPYNALTKQFSKLLDDSGLSFAQYPTIYSSFMVFSVRESASLKWSDDDSYDRRVERRVEFYVALNDDGTLKGVESLCWSPLRTDWTVDEVLRLQDAHEVARQNLNDAERALGPFRGWNA